MSKNGTVDYIIIGTGPAGCVLANRLSAEGNDVLVVEAGPNYDDDPAVQNYNGGSMMNIPRYFWSDVIARQPALKGQTMITGAGRLAGGGSSVNGQVFVRPTPYVLRKWEKIAGPQWSPEKVNERFRRLERFNGEKIVQGVHGTDGRLDIRQSYQDGGTLLQKFAESLAEASGCPVIDDYNDPDTPIGSYLRLQVYQKVNGKRASASVSFLSDIIDKDGNGIGRKLRVMYETTASRILFNKSKRAVGVEYIRQGVSGTVKAKKKVIVCAGLRSARILQQSGIGPRDVLEKAGIEVIHDSPNVGRNMMNDTYASAVFMVNPNDLKALENTDIGTYWRSGAFLPSARGGPKDKRQIQILFMYFGGNAISVAIMDIDNKSRGSVKIQSKDPLKPMIDDEGFLTDPEDMEEMKATYRKYIKGLADVLAKKDPSYVLLSPTQDELDDDKKLEDLIRKNFTQSFHTQGAVAMGNTPESAVNGWCEVNGVKDLLVADTSVIPAHMDGNPSSCSYVIGETIAEHLLRKE